MPRLRAGMKRRIVEMPVEQDLLSSGNSTFLNLTGSGPRVAGSFSSSPFLESLAELIGSSQVIKQGSFSSSIIAILTTQNNDAYSSHFYIFSRDEATLYEGLSVRRSVRRSVRWSVRR